jgi:hypothetical protein
MRRRWTYRSLVVLAIAAAAASSAYAYASSVGGVTNPPRLGSGSSSIGKYTLGTPTYDLDTNSPRNVDSITFTLSGASATATVEVRADAGGSWYSCDASAAPTITCDTTTPTQLTAVNANGNTLMVEATG